MSSWPSTTRPTRPGNKQRLRFRLRIFLFHHHARRNGRQRRAQTLAVAVGLVVAAACRGLGNGIGIERVHREVGRDHARADHGPGFVPGFPTHGERIPALRPFLRQHLIDEVAHVHLPPGIVKGIALVVAELSHVHAIRRGHIGWRPRKESWDRSRSAARSMARPTARRTVLPATIAHEQP